jgi:hypothetical protein
MAGADQPPHRERGHHQGDNYTTPAFEFASLVEYFACLVEYDEAGLVLDYPNIALRA